MISPWVVRDHHFHPFANCCFEVPGYKQIQAKQMIFCHSHDLFEQKAQKASTLTSTSCMLTKLSRLGVVDFFLKNWLARKVGNEGINLYWLVYILGMKLPSFPTKGQLEK